MSILNNDILSEHGNIQIIWDSYMEKQKPSKLVSFIMESIKNNIIDQINISNINNNDKINILHKLSESTDIGLFNFLDNKLSPYSENPSKLNKKNINSNINMVESLNSLSMKDESALLKAVIEMNLLNLDELQDFLDVQTLETITTAGRLVASCCESESSKLIGIGVQDAPKLTFREFGINESKILECVAVFVNEGVNLLPNDASKVADIVFPSETFDTDTLYSQDNIVSNLAKYDTLHSFRDCLLHSPDDMSEEMIVYFCTTVMDLLDQTIDELGEQLCSLLYMITGLFLSKKCDNENVVKNIRSILSEKQRSYFNSLPFNQPSGDKQLLTPTNKMNSLISYLKGCELENNNNADNINNLKRDISSILSDLDELEESMQIYNISNSDEKFEVSLESANTNIGSKIRDTLESKLNVLNTYSYLHDSLSESLLNRNFENAAKIISLEQALLEKFETDNLYKNSIGIVQETHTNYLSTMKLDVDTYTPMIKRNVGGLDTYQFEARQEIEMAIAKT